MNSRKIAVIAGIFMLSLIPLQAQWELGGLIDLNLASFSVKGVSSSENYSGRVGFGIGFVADRPLTDRISLHAQPMFLSKGGTVETSTITLVFKVNYLEIPLMFKYDFPINSTLTPYAMAGPTVGLLTGAKLVADDGETQDEKENTNTFDFGLGFGGGVSIPHDKLTFFAETRYVVGLANINKEVDEFTVKNRGLQIILGVTVPVGAK